MPSKVDKIKLTRDQDRRSRYTQEQVEEMRRLYAKGYTHKAIAEKLGASKSAVCYIVSEKAHSHLKEYRQVNPPKRRSREEASDYMRNLRRYKKSLDLQEK